MEILGEINKNKKYAALQKEILEMNIRRAIQVILTNQVLIILFVYYKMRLHSKIKSIHSEPTEYVCFSYCAFVAWQISLLLKHLARESKLTILFCFLPLKAGDKRSRCTQLS